MKVEDILSRVAVLYNDTDYVRVSKQMYLHFLDDAMSHLLMFYPECNLYTGVVELQKGVRQTLPLDGITFVRITRSVTLGTDGEIEKSYPVTIGDKRDLDSMHDWANAKGSAIISDYTPDDVNPYTFWVYPPALENGTNVEMVYSKVFDKYGSMSWNDALEETIPLRDNFMMLIVYYMLYLLYSTDSSSTLDREVANKYYASFQQQVSDNRMVTAGAGPLQVKTNPTENTSGAQQV